MIKFTAIHEAGHAVAHIRFNIEQYEATIVPSEGNRGSVTAEGENHVWSPEDAQNMVLAFCAGYAALVAAGWSRKTATRGARNDFDRAEGLIEQWELDGALEDWLQKAVALMREPNNRRAVDLIAKELLERKTVPWLDLEDLVRVADGELSEEEFADLKKLSELTQTPKP